MRYLPSLTCVALLALAAAPGLGGAGRDESQHGSRGCRLGLDHKVKGGRDIYFFANSTDKDVDTKVTLRGRKALGVWNPHTGQTTTAEGAHAEAGGQPVTTIRLALPATGSLFYIAE